MTNKIAAASIRRFIIVFMYCSFLSSRYRNNLRYSRKLGNSRRSYRYNSHLHSRFPNNKRRYFLFGITSQSPKAAFINYDLKVDLSNETKNSRIFLAGLHS